MKEILRRGNKLRSRDFDQSRPGEVELKTFLVLFTVRKRTVLDQIGTGKNRGRTLSSRSSERLPDKKRMDEKQVKHSANNSRDKISSRTDQACYNSPSHSSGHPVVINKLEWNPR